MKNLKLLYRREEEILPDAIYFAPDNETAKIYISSSQTIQGYHTTDFKKCFNINVNDITAGYESAEIVGLEFMCGEEQLCIALKKGDVILCNTTDNESECVGTFDCELQSMLWSPDQEIMLLVTNRGSVVAMTHDFDLITELDICADEFGDGKFVNVGWGRKETQFQGSAGKFVPGKETQPAAAEVVHVDRTMKVVWREDGQYFAISSVENEQRKFRVWNRNCELQYTSENVTGLETPFAWKPSGSLIASTQRKVHRHDVVFFELNGLQHGEFTLPFETKQVNVNKLQWNSNSLILMLWATDVTSNHTYLQLWSTSNYQWYLKQTFDYDEKVALVCWDCEQPYVLHVLLETGIYHMYNLAWCISKSGSVQHEKVDSNLEDASYVAVVDGPRVKLTPFKHMMVPPPMCAFQLSFKNCVRSVCFSQNPSTPNYIGVLTNEGQFICFADNACEFKSDLVQVEVLAAGGNGFTSQINPLSAYAIYEPDAESGGLCPNWWKTLRHLVWCQPNKLIGVASKPGNKDCILYLSLNDKMICDAVFDVDELIIGLCPLQPANTNEEYSVLVQVFNGKVLRKFTDNFETYRDSREEDVCLGCASPEMYECSFTSTSTGNVTFGVLSLSSQKRLFLNNTVLNNQCTSFSIHDEYIILTTTSHKMIFISRHVDVKDLEKKYSPGGDAASNEKSTGEIQRTVERGASLVIVTPSDTKVVMQLPRGNLELIHPRPLIISVVKTLLDNSDYKNAFLLMRKHRINMNLMHDHNREKFNTNVSTFIMQLQSVEYINIFLSDLREEDVKVTMYSQYYPAASKLPESLLTLKENKVDKICDAILSELSKMDDTKYFLSVLTAHVRKTKPQIEEALSKLHKMKETKELDDNHINDSLRHLHVMVDGRILYQEALATYDLDLTLMVAQVSNNDPKEYVPFLTELRSFENNFMRYKIDMFLKKYDRALYNIAKCPDHFSECIDVIKSHNLHREGLELFGKYSTQYREISNLYAEYLTSKHLYEEAGIILARCDNHKRAVKCFTTACSWEHALNSASALQYSEQDYIELAKSLADALAAKSKFSEAATVLEQEANDCVAAISVLCKGHLWSSALRLIRIHKLQDMTDTCFIPALEEAATSTRSTLQTYREQFDRHFKRLLKVREIKLEQQMQGLMNGDGDLDSDIASDFGSTVTGSSWSSVNSRTSHRTSKSRRKHERKRYSLREGSRFEEEGLLKALGEVINTFSTMNEDVHSLILHFSLFHMDIEARSLQELYESTHELLCKTKPKIWIIPDANSFNSTGPQSTVNSIIAARSAVAGETVTFTDLELAIPPKLNAQTKSGMHLYS